MEGKEKNNRKVQYWVAFAVALTSVTSSAAFTWTTSVIPKLHNNETDLIINDAEISWMVVAFSPGTILGTIASQFQSDIFGRRITLLASALPFCVGTMFILFFTTQVWALYLARFCWGFGGGMIKTVAVIYVAEIASKEIRGKLVAGNRFMFNLGSLMVVTIGAFVSYKTLSYMFIAFPIAYFLACWWISESPYYLLKENKVDAARKELMKLNGYKDKEILEQKLTEIRIHVKEDMRRSTTLKELFTGMRYRKALIISFGLRIFHAMSGTITIQQYLGRIMQDTDSSMSISTGLILFSVLKLIFSIMSTGIVDRVGRRPLLLYSYIGAFLSFAVVGTCFFVHEVIMSEKHFNLLSGNVIFVGIVIFNIFSTIGFDTLLNVIPSEIFPLNIKSLAITSMNLFGSLVAFVTMRGYQIMKDLTGYCGVFWFYAIACFVAAVFTYFIVPETKGKSLRDIQIELQGSLYEAECENVNLMKINNVATKLTSQQEEREKLN